jgi:tetratricopeptide (TPR) repeat protein
MPADPKRVQDIFAAVLELIDPAERSAHLDRECGDDHELRQRIEVLLAAHADSAGLPGADPIGTSSHLPTATHFAPAAGSIFAGRYKVREKLGEGGMGTVYVADQIEPVQRRIALKVLKTALASDRLLARFDQERQALALMDHPNIAKVLDAGVADSAPYFVMELIKGVPITKYCDEAKLTPKQRLELFIPVCQAVQHAHQKGIIHRDLKPSNILVGLYDGRPVPKVIDFGVAKATGPKLTDESVYTEVGAIIGTFEYMSPEQAELNNLDIDTRSDVYALGVVLYELLTGTVPHSRKDLQKAGIAEMLRIIKEVEPPKPSTRLSGSGSLPGIAASRQTEPRKLTLLLRNDLDWIVMKALEKDRSRRYETANGFAMDIQRYLADEPVLAGPPSASYRLRKFAKRNKVHVVAVSLVLATLLVGIAGTTFGLIRARIARDDEAEQRRIAQDKKDEAEKQKARAERAWRQALADFQATTDEAVEQLIGSKTELGTQERAYLEKTLERWLAFAESQEDDELGHGARADAHIRVGHLWSRLGRPVEARAEMANARNLLKRFVEQRATSPGLQDLLGAAHNNLGNLQHELGELEAARVEYETSRDLSQKLVEQYPDDAGFRKSLALAHLNLGGLLDDIGNREEAVAEYEKARDGEKELVEQFPSEPMYRQHLAMTHYNLGTVLVKIGKPDAARKEYEKALEIRKKLADQYPQQPHYVDELAETHDLLGNLLAELGQRQQAQTEFGTALALEKKLVDSYPAVPHYQLRLATTHNNLALLLGALGKREEARAEYEKALALQQKLVDQSPTVPTYQKGIAKTHNNLGVLLRDLNEMDVAATQYEKAIKIGETLVAQNPTVPEYQKVLADAHNNMGILLTAIKKFEAAGIHHDRALDLRKKLVDKYPSIPEYQVKLGGSFINIGDMLRKQNRWADSLKWFDDAIATLTPVHRAEPRDVTAKEYLSKSYYNRALAYIGLNKYGEALSDWDRALELAPPAMQPTLRAGRISSRVQTGLVLEAVADVEEVTKSSNWNYVQWYDFACAYSVAAGKYPDKKQAYGDRAMELLRSAVKAGWKELAHMAKDSDMDPLREREDYKKLIAELEAANKR